jgi:acyl-CoA dehydrogenase
MWLGMKLRMIVLPWGRRLRPPTDMVNRKVAELMMQQGDARARLTQGIYLTDERDDITGSVDAALVSTWEAEPVERRLREQGHVYRPGDDYDHWLAGLQKQDLLSEQEFRVLKRAREDVLRVIAVDDFPLGRRKQTKA